MEKSKYIETGWILINNWRYYNFGHFLKSDFELYLFVYWSNLRKVSKWKPGFKWLFPRKYLVLNFSKTSLYIFQMGQQLFKETEFLFTNFTQSGCKDVWIRKLELKFVLRWARFSDWIWIPCFPGFPVQTPRSGNILEANI